MSGPSGYRARVREFLAEAWDATRKGDEAYLRAFRRQATQAGYLYRNFPASLGGSEQTPDPIAAGIIRDEFARAHAPREIPGMGLSMVAPTLLEWGSDWQKSFFIPPTLQGDIAWAQGYSEPGAGSDLASLTTKATLDDRGWIINGHKIWTSRAWRADYLFLLARTEPDAPKHEGISYFLIDAKQPGIKIKRIRQLSGMSDFCELFLDDVRTPADWIVGPRGKGWQVSRSTLTHERDMVGSATASHDLFDRLISLARRCLLNGKPALEDSLILDRLVVLEAMIDAHGESGAAQNALAARGAHDALLGSLNKLISTNIADQVASIAAELLGEHGLREPDPDAPGKERWLQQVLGSIAVGIAGGTSNIQRNIIAERGLGLPRDVHGSA